MNAKDLELHTGRRRTPDLASRTVRCLCGRAWHPACVASIIGQNSLDLFAVVYIECVGFPLSNASLEVSDTNGSRVLLTEPRTGFWQHEHPERPRGRPRLRAGGERQPHRSALLAGVPILTHHSSRPAHSMLGVCLVLRSTVTSESTHLVITHTGLDVRHSWWTARARARRCRAVGCPTCASRRRIGPAWPPAPASPSGTCSLVRDPCQ